MSQLSWWDHVGGLVGHYSALAVTAIDGTRYRLSQIRRHRPRPGKARPSLPLNPPESERSQCTPPSSAQALTRDNGRYPIRSLPDLVPDPILKESLNDNQTHLNIADAEGFHSGLVLHTNIPLPEQPHPPRLAPRLLWS